MLGFICGLKLFPPITSKFSHIPSSISFNTFSITSKPISLIHSAISKNYFKVSKLFLEQLENSRVYFHTLFCLLLFYTCRNLFHVRIRNSISYFPYFAFHEQKGNAIAMQKLGIHNFSFLAPVSYPHSSLLHAYQISSL